MTWKAETDYMYVEAGNWVLNSFAANDMNTKVSLKFEELEKLHLQTAVQIQKVLKDEALQYGNAFSEQ